MAADATYSPAVHRLQGGNTLEVSTGGTIDVYGTLRLRSGATLTNNASLTSTGTITNSGTLANTGTVANTGTIKNSSDGQIAETVTANVAAATLVGYGMSSIGSSTAGARAYKLNRPTTVGAHKFIYVRGSTGGHSIVSATAAAQACKFNAVLSKIKFPTAAAKGITLHLIGASSTNWSIIGHSTAAATYTCT